MSRSSTAITATGALVRNAQDVGLGSSQDVEIQVTVDVADLLALLTGAELVYAVGRSDAHHVIFAVGLTDTGALIGSGHERYPEAQLLARVGLTNEQQNALRARLG
ncbi:MAG: hypothetical protein ABSE58_06150 [Candidatus Limnocylindrales bacterium]|jgi:hypothetical protein